MSQFIFRHNPNCIEVVSTRPVDEGKLMGYVIHFAGGWDAWGVSPYDCQSMRRVRSNASHEEAIAAGEKLLADLEKDREQFERFDKHEPKLTDAFGRRRSLQLGVPCGDSGHSLYHVSAKLGESVIRAHIASKQAELVEANEQARIELAGTPE